MKPAKQQIIDAFLHLLIDKDFDELSVKDIVQQAAISRSTFYLHFADKYELMGEVRRMLNDRFLSFYTAEQTGIQPVTFQICRHIFDYRAFYIREFSDASAIHKLSNRLAAHLLQTYQDQDYAIFASYGTIGYLSFWVREGFQTSPGEAAEKLLKIGFTDWTENISARPGTSL